MHIFRTSFSLYQPKDRVVFSLIPHFVLIVFCVGSGIEHYSPYIVQTGENH